MCRQFAKKVTEDSNQSDTHIALEERGIHDSEHFADCTQQERPPPNDKWHLDEVVITIWAVKHWLWKSGSVGCI